MYAKYSFFIGLLLCSFIFSNSLVAQTTLPNKRSEGRSQTEQAERDSVLGKKTTKKGKEIRPIFIPYITGGFTSNGNASLLQIGLTPVGGIAIDRFRIAAGPSFEYVRLNRQGFSDTYRTLGLLTFAEYRIVNIEDSRMFGNMRIFAHAEYAFNNIKYVEGDQSWNVNSLPIGGGFTQPLGNTRTSLYAVVLYDILFSNTPFQTGNGLIYRFGVGVGF